ncbi:MAG TPA: hypothetical protein PLI09_06520 [Candidatus Hydrogenedentes bacterium]|nr:hypothetical protein [Candidatus Hydrogenedentota bacterium]
MCSFFIAVMVLVLAVLSSCAHVQKPPPLAFDVVDTGPVAADVPSIKPWRTVTLDPDYGGCWIVAGDLDGDGTVEIVSAQNHNLDDTHYTSAASAQRLDGSIMWRWGDPNIGRKGLHHDVALQIHDWDGEGHQEVVLLADKALVELDGATGKERRRLSIPAGASDCLTFCDLSGVGRPADFLVKTRYTSLWAYDHSGTLLWQSELPGGYRTAHQARPFDLDRDGRDEIMAGYALLNHKGKVVWTFTSEKVDLGKGHLDCARILKKGMSPKSTRIVLTCCGAKNIAMIDGKGKTLWEISGRHFESIQVGAILPKPHGPHILVDIDHTPRGESDLWILDRNGNLCAKIRGEYCRHHELIDWNADGLDEIVVGHSGAMYDHTGRRIATLAAPTAAGNLLLGDFTGDGISDVARGGGDVLYIYQNNSQKKPHFPVPLGTPLNITYY